MLRNFILCQLAVSLMLCLSSSVAEPIVIFGNSSKPPKIYYENNEARGVLIDIMKYVDDKLPQEFVYELYPWERAYKNMLAAQGGIIGLSMNQRRLKILDYSAVMYYDELLLVVMRGNEFSYQTIKDLSGKKVGCLRSVSYGESFEEAKKQQIFILDEDNNPRQRLLKLLHGRIDVAIVGPGLEGLDRAIGDDLLLEQKRHLFTTLPVPFSRDPNFLGFAKAMKMKPFLEKFNQIIKQGYGSGEIQLILEQDRSKID